MASWRSAEGTTAARYLFLHNIDTLGADVDPVLLGSHIQSGAGLTFEVIRRRLEDRGGGLARLNGRVRLVEGLAMPREEAEFSLSYYNSNSCWIDLEQLLTVFGLSRGELNNEEKVSAAIRSHGCEDANVHHIERCEKTMGPWAGGCLSGCAI